MDKIIKKEYEWGKTYRNSEFFVAIVFALVALGDIMLGASSYLVLWIVISVFGFLHYSYLTKNRIYIQITNDGIKISSPYFKSRVKVIKWEQISNIKIKGFGMSRKIVLSLFTGKNIKIRLGPLSNFDRGSLIVSIKKVIDKEAIT